ncbi:vacuolar-processing enzyme [Tanacetum coccineum]|uniref:Vacuolar-processing enzyme n=1 Tax=Tanacetum coccineum TaxID=301880 RepID=A0ABQ4ZCG8_9ASTR
MNSGGPTNNPFLWAPVYHEHGVSGFLSWSAWVLYIGACHSGCLFEPGYLEDKSIYAITSSNCSQPSHSTKKAWYGPGTGYHSWATQFGRAWICDSEQHERRTRSVGEQFDEVKRNVTKSTVLDFGSKDLKDEKLFRYQGFKKER